MRVINSKFLFINTFPVLLGDFIAINEENVTIWLHNTEISSGIVKYRVTIYTFT